MDKSQNDREMEIEKKYPLWVRIGLWGSSKRGTLNLFAVSALIISVLNFAVAFWPLLHEETIDKGNLMFGILCLVGSFHYLLTMRWVDRNGNWGEASQHWSTFKETVLTFLGLIAGIVLIVGLVAGIAMIAQYFNQ